MPAALYPPPRRPWFYTWLFAMPLPCDREALLAFLSRARRDLAISLVASIVAGVFIVGVCIAMTLAVQGFTGTWGLPTSPLFDILPLLFALVAIVIVALNALSMYQWYSYVSWLYEALRDGLVKVEDVCGKKLYEIRH